MKNRTLYNILFRLAVGLALIAAFQCIGCAAPTGGGSWWNPTKTPASLSGVSSTLGWLVIPCMLVLGAAIFLFVYVPEGHRLSLSLGASAGGILAISLLLQTTLWLIPWIAGAILFGALGLFGWELYARYFKNRKNP